MVFNIYHWTHLENDNSGFISTAWDFWQFVYQLSLGEAFENEQLNERNGWLTTILDDPSKNIGLPSTSEKHWDAYGALQDVQVVLEDARAFEWRGIPSGDRKTRLDEIMSELIDYITNLKTYGVKLEEEQREEQLTTN